MPSRVAVDGQGNAYIASAGFGMQGSLTKIAGNLDRCEDRNGNGQIETSNTDQAADYGTDECVLWTADVGGFDARSKLCILARLALGVRDVVLLFERDDQSHYTINSIGTSERD